MEGCVWYCDSYQGHTRVHVEFDGRLARVHVPLGDEFHTAVAVDGLSRLVIQERAKLARAEYGRLH